MASTSAIQPKAAPAHLTQQNIDEESPGSKLHKGKASVKAACQGLDSHSFRVTIETSVSVEALQAISKAADAKQKGDAAGST